jgi:sugar lactone lactonase YvrE
MNAVVSVAADHVDLLGESPCWRSADRCLYWVDSFAPAIRRLDPSTGAIQSFAMPADIGSFVFAADGSVVAGLRTGFSRFELGKDGARFIANPLPDDPRLMLNDGKCDRRGRYWCASVHADFAGRQAALYRLDPDLSTRQVDGGFIIGNGIAFSPDDRRMYLADSRDAISTSIPAPSRTGASSSRPPTSRAGSTVRPATPRAITGARSCMVAPSRASRRLAA